MRLSRSIRWIPEIRSARDVARVGARLLMAAVASGCMVSLGCSSYSELVGGGGCESFCTKWVGARCRNGPTKEDCLKTCNEEKTRCPDATNAYLRCATLEAQIACETGTGEPRVVGCAPRESAKLACLACERACTTWARPAATCLRSPQRDECIATCLDPRCAIQHARIATCLSVLGDGRVRVECDDEGVPVEPLACSSDFNSARICTDSFDHSEPFHWMPPLRDPPVPDAGDAAGDGAR